MAKGRAVAIVLGATEKGASRLSGGPWRRGGAPGHNGTGAARFGAENDRLSRLR